MPKEASAFAWNPEVSWRYLRLNEKYRLAVKTFKDNLDRSDHAALKALFKSVSAKRGNEFKRLVQRRTISNVVLEAFDLRGITWKSVSSLTSKEAAKKHSDAVLVSQLVRPQYLETLNAQGIRYRQLLDQIVDYPPYLLDYLAAYGDILGFPIDFKEPEPDPVWLAILWNIRPYRAFPLPSYDRYLMDAKLRLSAQRRTTDNLIRINVGVFDTKFKASPIRSGFKAHQKLVRSWESAVNLFREKSGGNRSFDWNDTATLIDKASAYEHQLFQERLSRVELAKMYWTSGTRSKNVTYATLENWGRSAEKNSKEFVNRFSRTVKGKIRPQRSLTHLGAIPPETLLHIKNLQKKNIRQKK